MSYETVILEPFEIEKRLEKIDELLTDGYKVAFIAKVDVFGVERQMVYLHKEPLRIIDKFTAVAGSRPYRGDES